MVFVEYMDYVALTCLAQECNRIREMDNRPQTGSITILRGPFPANRPLADYNRLTREELSQIIDYSTKPKDNNKDAQAQEGNKGPDPASQPAAPDSAGAGAAPPAKKKRLRLIVDAPLQQTVPAAQNEAPKEPEKKTRWFPLQDEDVAFFNSVLPHLREMSARQVLKFRIQVLQILENTSPEYDDPNYEEAPEARRDRSGFYCGNCGQQYFFNRNF